MRAAETISELLLAVAKEAKPGAVLANLDRFAESYMAVLGATSFNKGYHPEWAHHAFPGVLCLSVNDMICHGIPDLYVLKEGDILTIDCGIMIDGQAGDAGMTIPIGKISSRDERLLHYSRKAVGVGLKAVKAGEKVTAVGKAIEQFAKTRGFVVNHAWMGHGIGEKMHEMPAIPMHDVGLEHIETKDEKGRVTHTYKEHDNIPVFTDGQLICIEPHLTYKDEFGTLLPDMWGVKTRDGKNSAMFEVMAKVTPSGVEVLTNHFNPYE